MNYRHAFHAGSHADVLKHAALLFCLDALRRKPAPFAVFDSHAGCGRYDLSGDEAHRNPEWRDGIGRLWGWIDAPPLVKAYLDAVRRLNAEDELRIYPGSPALIATRLRAADVLMACELNDEEYAALRRNLPRQPNVQLHARDGWEALRALLPPVQKRGLVLIDPPYEVADELPHAAFAIGRALKGFGHGIYVWWRPMKGESALAAADAELASQGARATLRADLWVDTPRLEGSLAGSSLLLINPPFGLEEALRASLPALAERLSRGASGWRITASPRL